MCKGENMTDEMCEHLALAVINGEPEEAEVLAREASKKA